MTSASSSTSGTSGTRRPRARPRAHADRIVGVHVCDVREPDAELRATASCRATVSADVPRVLRLLDAAGWDGFYDLEVFSDDGSMGTAFPTRCGTSRHRSSPGAAATHSWPAGSSAERLRRRRRGDRQPLRRPPRAVTDVSRALPPGRACPRAERAAVCACRAAATSPRACGRRPIRRTLSRRPIWSIVATKATGARGGGERTRRPVSRGDGDDDAERPRRGGGRPRATATGRCSRPSRS